MAHHRVLVLPESVAVRLLAFLILGPDLRRFGLCLQCLRAFLAGLFFGRNRLFDHSFDHWSARCLPHKYLRTFFRQLWLSSGSLR